MKYFLFIGSLIVVLAACKKVETPVSPQQKLRAVDWVIDTAYVKYLSYKGTDSDSKGVWPEKFIDGKFVYPRPDCLSDDYFKFSSLTNGSHYTGPSKCGVSETENIDFAWGLYNAETRMRLYGLYSLFGEDVDADVDELSDDKFQITYTKKVGANKEVTSRITYKFKKK